MPFPVPPALRILRPFATPTGAGDTLQAQDTTGIPDGAVAQVVSNGQFYYLNKSSSATADGDNIIQPAAGTGRWFMAALPFANLLWVNPLGLSTGTGSVQSPLQTPAAALALVPSGASATLVLAPGDYSATPALSIADRDINIICLGGAVTGAKTPLARAVLPSVTFAASAATMQFYASNCALPSVTVQDTVNATLVNCTSVWSDAGNLATVRATGEPLGFGSDPPQSISGTIGSSVLYGMLVGDLSGANIISTRGRVNTGATVAATSNLAFYTHEFNSGATCTATTGLFMDQWSLFQALEASVNLGATPPISVQETSSLRFQWGAQVWANNNYLNPFANFGTAQASAAIEWLAAPRQCYAAEIFVQAAATFAEDKTFTLHSATTVAGLNAGATGLAITLPTGQLRAQAGLATPVPVPMGNFLAMRGTFTTTVNGTVVQVQVVLY